MEMRNNTQASAYLITSCTRYTWYQVHQCCSFEIYFFFVKSKDHREISREKEKGGSEVETEIQFAMG